MELGAKFLPSPDGETLHIPAGVCARVFLKYIKFGLGQVLGQDTLHILSFLYNLTNQQPGQFAPTCDTSKVMPSQALLVEVLTQVFIQHLATRMVASEVITADVVLQAAEEFFPAALVQCSVDPAPFDVRCADAQVSLT